MDLALGKRFEAVETHLAAPHEAPRSSPGSAGLLPCYTPLKIPLRHLGGAVPHQDITKARLRLDSHPAEGGLYVFSYVSLVNVNVRCVHLGTVTAPHGVEGALFVNTTVGVCTEEVTLTLNQGCG